MIKRITSGITAFLLSITSLFVFAPSIARAAVDTCTWTGATSTSWNTAGNWNCSEDGAAVPGNGDSLVFPFGTGALNRFNMNNDIANGQFASITFSGATQSGESSYAVTGNAIAIASGITASVTGSQYGVSFNLDIDVSIAQNITVNTSVGNSVNLGGVVSGAGGINKSGAGSLLMEGENTYSGITNISGGYAGAQNATAFGSASAGTTIGEGAYADMRFHGGGVINESFTINSAGSERGYPLAIGPPCHGGYTCKGDYTLAGDIILGNDVLLATYGGANVIIAGALSGDYTIGLAQGDMGSLVINSSNNTSKTSNGTIETEEFTTEYKDDAPETSIQVGKKETAIVTGKYRGATVNEGGVLKGTGEFTNSLSVNQGAIIAPGLSPGCITVGEHLNLRGEYQFEIKGTAACSDYDQIQVGGDVEFGYSETDDTYVSNFATLKVSSLDGYVAPAGTVFTIIDNKGSEAVRGTFKDLAEGATFEGPDGAVLKISYVGGDGNDVTLTVITAGTPDTGFGMLLNNPIAILAATTVAAGAILVMSRRMKFATQRTRR